MSTPPLGGPRGKVMINSKLVTNGQYFIRIQLYSFPATENTVKHTKLTSLAIQTQTSHSDT